MKRITVGAAMTPEYNGWRSKRINDNIPRPREECVRSIEENLRVVLSELEIIKEDFRKRIGKEDRAARRGKDASRARCSYPQVGS
ncbi:hypothetical protein Gohar_021139 [Gossypium harknessii]|uniref:Uncharacterized protein n=1 Tax=Gossypium harknessii TaxID=34285 RepID=A0A7J9I9X2_9ROSI|nr:hypothetical protein [Gossypium harknessii]